jgi:hypothetical protein
MLLRCATCGHPYWRMVRFNGAEPSYRYGDVGEGSIRYGCIVRVCSTCATELLDSSLELYSGDDEYPPAASHVGSPYCAGMPKVRWREKENWREAKRLVPPVRPGNP